MAHELLSSEAITYQKPFSGRTPPTPAGRTYSAPQTSWLDFRRPLRGRGRKGREEKGIKGRRKKMDGGKRRGGIKGGLIRCFVGLSFAR